MQKHVVSVLNNNSMCIISLDMMWRIQLLVLLCILSTFGQVFSQLAWTNIQTSFVKGQLDMWTKSSSGCPCPDNSNEDCACCVDGVGGCTCEGNSRNRCGQCGLQSYCDKMCNVTISSSVMKNASGRATGEIKSPSSASGPLFCWYKFVGQPGERIELQIYRIKRLGKLDLKGRSCVGGSLRFSSGERGDSPLDMSICGENERYSPPVVLFKDFDPGAEGRAGLHFRVEESSGSRSQFIAHYAFVQRDNGKETQLRLKGGSPLPGSNSLQEFLGKKDEKSPTGVELGCDWSFEEELCTSKGGPCFFASPGYPGIYDPNRTCKYLISLGPNSHSKIRITFQSFSLPPNLCVEHFVSIYDGQSIRDPILQTLCGYLNAGESFEFEGPDILVEFSSSYVLPPYHFNGFAASIEFVERGDDEFEDEEEETLQGGVPNVQGEESEKRNKKRRKLRKDSEVAEPGEECRVEYIKDGEGPFSGLVSSERDFQGLRGKKCRVILKGVPGDVLKILFKELHLQGAKECGSYLRISTPPSAAGASRHIHKFCSPYDMYETRDGIFSHDVPLLINSSTVYLDFKYSGRDRDDVFEALFDFHNVLTEGHPVPNSTCDAIYSSYGSLYTRGPMKVFGESMLLRQFGAESIRCSTGLIPQENESVVIKIKSVSGVSEAMSSECSSSCNENGCRCSSRSPLSDINHVLIAPFNGGNIVCLCGNFTELLPLKVVSSTSLVVTYNASPGEMEEEDLFLYTSTFNFNTNNYEDLCYPKKRILQPSGVISSGGSKRRKDSNQLIYYHSYCQWFLDMDTRVLLNIKTNTKHFDCSTWNISLIPERPRLPSSQTVFCPEDVSKDFALNSTKITLVLSSLSPYPLDYTISWKPFNSFSVTKTSIPTEPPHDNSVMLDEDEKSASSSEHAVANKAASATANSSSPKTNPHLLLLLLTLMVKRVFIS